MFSIPKPTDEWNTAATGESVNHNNIINIISFSKNIQTKTPAAYFAVSFCCPGQHSETLCYQKYI
jgi:hypothetical protein